MTTTTPTTIDFETNKVLFGRCKWYNTKNGYGFITILNTDKDIFIHHNYIRKSSNDEYKYLVMGEYVQFMVVENTNSSNDNHKYIATDVCGIGGGKLMCDTRKEYRENKLNYKRSLENNDEDNDDSDDDGYEQQDSRRRAPQPSKRRFSSPNQKPQQTQQKLKR